jgi:hypothetical protein
VSRAHELWERYRRGEAVRLGDEVVLSQDSLQVHDLSVGLNTLLVPRLGDDGGLVIGQIGAPQPLLVVPATALEDVQAALEVLGRIVNEVPYLERRSVTGWPPGSVGDVSAQIGYDVRDLRPAGPWPGKDSQRLCHGCLVGPNLAPAESRVIHPLMGEECQKVPARGSVPSHRSRARMTQANGRQHG